MVSKKEKKNSLEKARKLLITGSSLVLFLSTLRFAFTKNQREDIVRRDDEKCQNPDCINNGNCYVGGKFKGQVHHILPQRYAEKLPKKMNVDFPENGILLCLDCHTGWSGIHPDISGARTAYNNRIEEIDMAVEKGLLDDELAVILKKAIVEGENKDSFDLVFGWRKSLLERKKIYWVEKWDGLLFTIAIMRTIDARKKGWVFSEKTRGKQWRLNQIVVKKIDAYIGSLNPTQFATLLHDLSGPGEPARGVMYKLYQRAMKMRLR